MSNPLMEAAHSFIRELEGVFAAGASLVRLTSSPSDRSSVLKSLRLMEWSPDSRWPLIIIEDVPAASSVRMRLHEQYGALAEGLGEDGCVVATLVEPARDTDTDGLDAARPLYADSELERAMANAGFARLLRQAAKQVVEAAGEYIDGLGLVLLPPANLGASATEGRHYQQLVSHLKLTVEGDPHLRLLAYDPAGLLERVAPAHAAFAVDEPALRDYLQEAASEAVDATAERPVAGVKGSDQGRGARLSPEQRKEVEEALGRKLPSDDVAATLRIAMFEAGQMLADGHFAEAAERLRAARMLCRLSGLPTEEAVLLMATGSAFLSSEQPDRALHAFELADRIARDEGLAAHVQVHASLGVGGVHLMAERWAQADAAYAQGLEAIPRTAGEGDDQSADASPTALTIELWRLRAHCAAEMGDLSLAASHAAEALAVAAAELTTGDDLEQTTAPLMVDQLAPRLEAAGQASQARSLRARLSELQSAPALGGAAGGATA